MAKEEQLNEYCLEVKHITTVTEKVIIKAHSRDEAVGFAYGIASQGKIDMSDPIDTDKDWDIDIDSYSANEDDTFDSEQFSDTGMQRFTVE